MAGRTNGPVPARSAHEQIVPCAARDDVIANAAKVQFVTVTAIEASKVGVPVE